METEVVLSGYCKCIDGSRTVIVEEGEPDCLYPDCPHAPGCPLARSIKEIRNDSNSMSS